MRPLALFTLLTTACTAYGGDATELATPLAPGQAQAIFAGGCFWCIEKDFEKLDGVIEAVSGYSGGASKGPTYKQVSSGSTEHLEAIQVIYDPKKVTYPELVAYFFRHVDPTQADGQFCDRGYQYTTAVFYDGKAEKQVAEQARDEAAKVLGQEIVTAIRPSAPFWVAEAYHQDFYKKNPAHYTRYRTGCGRDARVKALWGDPSTH